MIWQRAVAAHQILLSGSAMEAEDTTNTIELRVESVAQLFHTLDPFPFRERDLGREAEEFIVDWARELAADAPIAIIIHLPESESASMAVAELGLSFRRFFTDRVGMVQRDLNELFRVGRRSLAIGVPILIMCFVLARLLADSLADTPFGPLAEESLLILGWVANWRPIEIFLYDWWPIIRRRNLYRRLAAASVRTRPFKVAALAT